MGRAIRLYQEMNLCHPDPWAVQMMKQLTNPVYESSPNPPDGKLQQTNRMFSHGLLSQMMREQLTDPDYKYDTGLRDQNAIVYLLKKHWPEMRTKLQLVNKQYCLNCYWRDLMAIGDIKSSEKRVRYVYFVQDMQESAPPLPSLPPLHARLMEFFHANLRCQI